MLGTVLLLLFVSTLNADLASVLRSPSATLSLYSSFKAENGFQYGASEDRMRFKVWLASTKFAAAVNARETSFQLGVNLFSAMTAEERRQYLGKSYSVESLSLMHD